MNTQPQDPQHLRALELSIQARRESLSAEDQGFLASYLSAHPDVAEEAREMDAFLTRLDPGPLAPRPGFQEELQAAVADWGRLEHAAAETAPAPRGWFAARWRALVGPGGAPEGVSGSTLFLGRSLAFYLGAASVICAFLLLRDPAEGPEVRTNDRAHTLTGDPIATKRPGPGPDLRGPRPK